MNCLNGLLSINFFYMALAKNVKTRLEYLEGVLAGLSVNIGDYKYSTKTSDHNTWLICDGRTISRTTYSALFSIVGISFGGGDGSTTFNLPDFRGRVFGAVGQSSGLSNRILGDKIGSENHTLTINEMPSHHHNLATGTGIGGTNGSNWDANTEKAYIEFAASGRTIISNTGGGQAHNNMQPTLFGGNVFIFSGVV